MANGVVPPSLLRRGRHAWLSPRLWLRRILLWAGAVSVGVAAIAFALGAEIANDLHQRMVSVSSLLPFVVGPAGLAFVVWVTRRFLPDSKGSGIPQTIAALGVSDDKLRDKLLSPKIAIGKFFLTIVALLSGASVGREGPTVQIGASIMHALGRLTRFSRIEAERGLILAGGAAGVAAAFNTPLVSNWDNYDTWIERGSVTAEQRANQIWKQLLVEYEQPPLDEAIDEALRDYMARRKAEA